MAKQNRKISGKQLQGPHGKGMTFEHSESFDDSLLPDPVELEKYKQLDPDIIPWLKARAEKEQDARLDYNKKKVDILEKNNKRYYRSELLAMLYAFLIIIVAMGLSAFFLDRGQNTQGTIFAGVSILAAANAFLSISKINRAKKKASTAQRSSDQS